MYKIYSSQSPVPENVVMAVVTATMRDLHLEIGRRNFESARVVLSRLSRGGRPVDPNIIVNGCSALSLAVYEECYDIVEVLYSLFTGCMFIYNYLNFFNKFCFAFS